MQAVLVRLHPGFSSSPALVLPPVNRCNAVLTGRAGSGTGQHREYAPPAMLATRHAQHEAMRVWQKRWHQTMLPNLAGSLHGPIRGCVRYSHEGIRLWKQ